MALQQSIPVKLKYGCGGQFSCELDASRVSVLRPGPAARRDVAECVQRALASPLELPTIDLALVPEDKAVIALDLDTPCAAEVVAGIWLYLERAGLSPSNVTILQPAVVGATRPQDPRLLLPDNARDAVSWKIHDPTDKESCAYLATSSAGDRIYLSRVLVDADFVLPVGLTGFDPLLGYRGTNSVLFPGLSDLETLQRTVGQGHAELAPGDQRPLRQLVDEIAWLAGILFSVQVVAAEDRGIVDVVAGSTDAVLKRCRELVDDNWLITMPDRVETVVVAVSNDVGGHGWTQVGRALATARQLVEPNGRIIVLSEMTEEPGDGVQLLRNCEDPLDIMPALRKHPPPDLLTATQLAAAAGWARLFLMSRLEDALVEDLFMLPVTSDAEVTRLLESSESCALIGSAQHTFGIVG